VEIDDEIFTLSVYPRLTQLSASSSSSRHDRREEVIARDERVQATLPWSSPGGVIVQNSCSFLATSSVSI